MKPNTLRFAVYILASFVGGVALSVLAGYFFGYVLRLGTLDVGMAIGTAAAFLAVAAALVLITLHRHNGRSCE